MVPFFAVPSEGTRQPPRAPWVPSGDQGWPGLRVPQVDPSLLRRRGQGHRLRRREARVRITSLDQVWPLKHIIFQFLF